MTVRRAVFPLVLLLNGLLSAIRADVVHLDLPPAEGVTSAAFDCLSDVPAKSAKGLLILVPGANGNGAAMLAEPAWADFARANGLMLGALSFTSDSELLTAGDGYYDTAKASGRIAVEAIRKAGADGLPVYLYGFSGGAHFTASFVENFPERIAGWCAASFGERQQNPVNAALSAGRAPPGILACGSDDPRIGKMIAHFHRGRELGRRWTWIEVPGLAHARHPALEDFVRAWFAARVKAPKAPGIWVDISSAEDASHSADTAKTLLAWLPDADLRPRWAALTRKLTQGVIEHCVKLKAKDYPQLTLFLRLPANGERPRGVLCLCTLADNAGEVREQIRNGKDGWFRFADDRQLAILGWGSHNLWDPTLNWDELPRDRAQAINATFDAVATGWSNGVRWFAQRYGIPENGFLMTGSCGAGQFVQRLALHKPDRFLAVHANIPGSFDIPTRDAKTVLWCLTTGERLAGGYERSLKFFATVRKLRYPIVYKAYPGVSHHESSAKTIGLAQACFDFALRECERATRLNGGRPTKPDWEDLFASAADIADIRNQLVFPVDDYSCIPLEFRMLLPGDLKDVWLEE